ncbi:hypothetical protein [Clostridium sp. BL-8]|uniref:hypothetical protein n=1 Tax=Clostridium sp. BL-8 TaxID=349938 RepID=UPI0009CB6AA2|nr:hypothetical protein [Clostridium sp. BL-8]OOM69833.1 hypothetical protein CLOBL_51450 [Clostridium sp. BL-8]
MKDEFKIEMLFSKVKGLIKVFRKVFETKPYENNKEIFYDYRTEKLQLNSYEKRRIENYKEKIKDRLLF